LKLTINDTSYQRINISKAGQHMTPNFRINKYLKYVVVLILFMLHNYYPGNGDIFDGWLKYGKDSATSLSSVASRDYVNKREGEYYNDFSSNNHTEKIEKACFQCIDNNIKDLKPIPMNGEPEIALFWAISKSGTSSVKAILNRCLDLRMAGSTALIDYEENPNELELIDLSASGHIGRFVNIDFGYLSGLQLAKDLRMADSGLIDVAVTGYLHEAAQIFTPQNPVRLFTIMRHPVERMLSAYYYSKISLWEKTYDENRPNLTLLEFTTEKKYYVDNWVTRMLSGSRKGYPVTNDDYEYAKSFLKEKCLIMLLDQFDESIDRLLDFMGWTIKTPDCVTAFTHKTPSNANPHQDLSRRSKEWKAMMKKNSYDVKLYYFAIKLFKGEQKKLVRLSQENNDG